MKREDVLRNGGGRLGEDESRRGWRLQDEGVCLDGRMKRKQPEMSLQGACRIIHHIQWQYHPCKRAAKTMGRSGAHIEMSSANEENFCSIMANMIWITLLQIFGAGFIGGAGVALGAGSISVEPQQ